MRTTWRLLQSIYLQPVLQHWCTPSSHCGSNSAEGVEHGTLFPFDAHLECGVRVHCKVSIRFRVLDSWNSSQQISQICLLKKNNAWKLFVENTHKNQTNRKTNFLRGKQKLNNYFSCRKKKKKLLNFPPVPFFITSKLKKLQKRCMQLVVGKNEIKKKQKTRKKKCVQYK